MTARAGDVNYRDMARIAADPSAVRERARLVKTLLGARATPWQTRFLDRMARFEGPGLLPMDDREVLHRLTGKASRRKEKAGYRAAVLVEKLWRLRHDVDEEDESFLDDLMADGADVAPTENQWRKLFAVARELGEIDHYVA